MTGGILKSCTAFYFDMDGVLAKWEEVSEEETHEEGYFLSRTPEAELIRVVKHMQAEGFNVNILSSVYEDNHSKKEKDTWLKKQGLFLNVIFVPYGKDKKDYINKNAKYQFLIDDFGKNLNNWSEEGDEFISIKFMNEVNSRPRITIADNGAMQLVPDSWTGYRIDHRMSAKQMYNTLVGLTKML